MVSWQTIRDLELYGKMPRKAGGCVWGGGEEGGAKASSILGSS